MRDYRAMMEAGTTAQMIKLLEHDHDPGLETYTIEELMEMYVEARDDFEYTTEDLNEDKIDILHEAADLCNILYGIIWYMEKILKIEDGKRRKKYAEKMVKGMVKEASGDRGPKGRIGPDNAERSED